MYIYMFMCSKENFEDKMTYGDKWELTLFTIDFGVRQSLKKVLLLITP